MKNVSLLALVITLFACKDQADKNHSMQTQIDSLQNKLNNTYKPGFGEFMSSIQVHHAKLWFAGQGRNWKLAEFEIAEMQESLEEIKQYCKDREETNSIAMIYPALDSISHSVQKKDFILFNANYLQLTNTCNNCHRATHHEFNKIKIPDSPPFSNQVFKDTR